MSVGVILSAPFETVCCDTGEFVCTHRSGIRLRLPQAQVGLSDLSSGRGSIIPESFAAIQACVVFFFPFCTCD